MKPLSHAGGFVLYRLNSINDGSRIRLIPKRHPVSVAAGVPAVVVEVVDASSSPTEYTGYEN